MQKLQKLQNVNTIVIKRFYIRSYKCAMTHAQQSLQTIKIKIIQYYQLYLIYKRFTKTSEENEQTYMNIAWII